MNKQIISTTQIAQICGVSQGTVDRALNNRKGISPKTKEKILSVAKEYGYRPNIHARSMAGGKSQLIGVVVFDLKNQYFSDIVTSIEKYCSTQNYSIVVMFTNKDHEKEIQCIQKLYWMAVDGIILCPVNSGEEYENFLLSLHIPVVTLGNRLKRIPHVGINDALAMKDTVEYVLKSGYEKLVYVKPDLHEKNSFAQTERCNSFIEVCARAGVAYTITGFLNAARELDSQKPTAFICPTDIYAIRLLPVVKAKQAGIIGFDNIRLIDEIGLKLDSVAYDVESAAKAVSDYIISQKSIPASIQHKLVCRGSLAMRV